MKEGLVLFGDNAYLNSPLLATPYPNVRRGSCNNYNFYHSQVSVIYMSVRFSNQSCMMNNSLLQLCIHVECAFGMLVQRWGILQMALSSRFSITKIIALVMALAKLHNYCISLSDSNVTIEEMLVYLHSDLDQISTNKDGFVRVDHNSNNYCCPDLIGGGEHFLDMPNRNLRRLKQDLSILPCSILHQHVIGSHKTRPRLREMNEICIK